MYVYVHMTSTGRDAARSIAHDYVYMSLDLVHRIHAKNATPAWIMPILSTRILGQNNHAKRRDHGISPGFPVHYQDLEH